MRFIIQTESGYENSHEPVNPAPAPGAVKDGEYWHITVDTLEQLLDLARAVKLGITVEPQHYMDPTWPSLTVCDEDH